MGCCCCCAGKKRGVANDAWRVAPAPHGPSLGAFPYGFTPGELEALQLEFAQIDADGSGQVSVEELTSKTNISFITASWLMKEHDLDNDGQLSFQEFVRLKRQLQWQASLPAVQRQAALRVLADEMFQQYASSGEVLQQRDMKKLFQVRFGVTVSQEEFEQHWSTFDQNDDGVIDKEEFRQLIFLLSAETF